MSTSTFFTLGLIVAISLIVEALMLLKSEGRLTPPTTITTAIEFLWLLVCIYAIFSVDLSNWTFLIPASYIAYFIAATKHFHGFGKDATTMEDIKELRIPLNFLKVEMLVGVVLLVMTGIALLTLN